MLYLDGSNNLIGTNNRWRGRSGLIMSNEVNVEKKEAEEKMVSEERPVSMISCASCAISGLEPYC